MNWLGAVAGAVAALAGLVIPVYKWKKGRDYDQAIADYKAWKHNRDNAPALRPDEYHFYDELCKEAARKARSLYPIRAERDLR